MNNLNATATLVLDTWLIVLIGILVCLSIIAAVYKIISYRRLSIVNKKVDYLVEDLIYKSELLTPSIELLINISDYVDKIKSNVDFKYQTINQYLASESKNIKVIDDSKKSKSTKSAPKKVIKNK